MVNELIAYIILVPLVAVGIYHILMWCMLGLVYTFNKGDRLIDLLTIMGCERRKGRRPQ